MLIISKILDPISTTDHPTLAIALPIAITMTVLALIVTVVIIALLVLKKYGTGTYSPQRAEIDRGLKLQEKCSESKGEPVAKQLPQAKERTGANILKYIEVTIDH